jgi:predicted transposase YdaD
MQSSVFQMGRQEGRQEGQQEAQQQGLARLFEKRLGRPLDDAERATLMQRLSALSYDHLVDVRDELSADALAAWLRNPDAA